jgi:nitroreductase
MDVVTALRARGSTRAFLNRPVGRDQIAAVLDAARFAPSGTNVQPWQVHVVSGAVRDRVVAEVTQAAVDERERHTSPFDFYPTDWRDPYLSRRRACGWGLYGRLGIQKGDRDAMLAQELRNYTFFDAPVGLFLFIDHDLPIGSWLDTGMFVQSVMLAAQAAGLATCPQYSWAPFHRVIRPILDAPEGATLVCGIALGYADPSAPVNGFRPDRLRVDEFTTWHGDPGTAT